MSPSAELPRVFGVIMDTTFASGTVTLVALADGTASLYASTGGGVIGGGAHERVAVAAPAASQDSREQPQDIR